ncbi:hypothetical protein ACF0H5_003661 [Mactra antiquata]
MFGLLSIFMSSDSDTEVPTQDVDDYITTVEIGTYWIVHWYRINIGLQALRPKRDRETYNINYAGSNDFRSSCNKFMYDSENGGFKSFV